MEELQSKKFNQAEINFIKLQISKYQSLNDSEAVLSLSSFLRDYSTETDRSLAHRLSKALGYIKVYGPIEQSDYISSIKTKLYYSHDSIQRLAPRLFFSVLQALDKLGFKLSESEGDEDLKMLMEFYQKKSQSTESDIKKEGGEQQNGNIADKGN